MSKGLSDLQATIQSYGDSSNAINQFIQNSNSEFYDDWKSKVDAAKEKLESARKLGDEIGEGYLGAKATHFAYKQFVNKFYNKKNQSDGDEDGKGDYDENNEPSNEGENTGGERDVDADEADEIPKNMEPKADIGGENGFELQNMNTTNQPLQTSEEGNPIETSFGENVSEVPTSSSTAQIGARVSSSKGNVQSDILEQDPESTSPISEGTSDILGEASEGVGELTSGIGGAVGDAVLGGLSVGLEALGPLGLLGGIGVGLYELFHHNKPKPEAPNLATASSRGEMVIPSYDSVIDTPASMSAF